LSADALDLINRQQADIRKLQLENEKLEIKLKGKIESSNKARVSGMEVIKKQEAEIERLQTENNIYQRMQRDIVSYDDFKKSILKEFVDRFEKARRNEIRIGLDDDGYPICNCPPNSVNNCIFKVYKEMVGEEW
jgi:hypothetical protein